MHIFPLSCGGRWDSGQCRCIAECHARVMFVCRGAMSCLFVIQVILCHTGIGTLTLCVSCERCHECAQALSLSVHHARGVVFVCQAGIALFLCHPECVMFVSCTCLFYVLCQVLLFACHAGVALIYLSRRSRVCLRVMQKVSCSCLPRTSPLACDPRGRCPTRVP